MLLALLAALDAVVDGVAQHVDERRPERREVLAVEAQIVRLDGDVDRALAHALAQPADLLLDAGQAPAGWLEPPGLDHARHDPGIDAVEDRLDDGLVVRVVDLDRALPLAQHLLEVAADQVPRVVQGAHLGRARGVALFGDGILEVMADLGDPSHTEDGAIALERVDDPLHVLDAVVHTTAECPHEVLGLGEELDEPRLVAHDVLEELQQLGLTPLGRFLAQPLGDVGHDHQDLLGRPVGADDELIVHRVRLRLVDET